MTLDLFRLLVFVTVVDRGGYSAAARHLHLAQSTVSHHVSELERTCGAELLRYRERTVHLTPAGHEVYHAAMVMLAEQDRLGKSLGDLKGGLRGRIRLGASIALEQRFFVNDVIAPFCRSHPGTSLAMRFGHSQREAQAVLDRELDLAYVIKWHLPADAQFEHLHDAELTFLVAREHPLADQASVTVEDIAQVGLITAPLSGPEWFYFGELLRERGLSGDRSAMEIDGLQARFLAATAGLGITTTFVPSWVKDMHIDGLAVLQVEGPPVTVELGLVRQIGGPGTTSVDALAERLRSLSPRKQG